MINFIKNIFNKTKNVIIIPDFTNNKEDFMLKHEHNVGKYYYVLYSGNKGVSYKYIKKYFPPLFTIGDSILEYSPSIKEFYFDSERTSFESIKKEFSSHQVIVDYIEEQRKIYETKIIEHKIKQQEYIDKVNNNLK